MNWRLDKRFCTVALLSGLAFSVFTAAKPVRAQVPQPSVASALPTWQTAAAFRFEMGQIEGLSMEGGMAWVGHLQQTLNIGQPGPYAVWVEYVDNGPRTMRFQVNEVTKTSVPNQPWLRLGEVSGPTVSLEATSTAAYPGRVRRFVLARDLTWQPGEAQTVAALPEFVAPLGFARQWVAEHSQNFELQQWLSAVRAHYNIPTRPLAPVVDENNNLLLNGKPHFSIAFFHTGPNPLLTNSGITDYIGSSAPPGLNYIRDYHMQWRAYDKLINEYKDHPGDPQLVLHYICDEPENVGVSREELVRLNGLVKTLDPTKPTFINISQIILAGTAGSIADAVGFDFYPVPDGRIADVGPAIDAIRIALGDRKPVIYIPQVFDWAAYGGHDKRMPTPDEVRAQTYMGLTHGVKGLWFYEWPAPEMSSRTSIADIHPQVWAAAQQMVQDMHTLEPALIGPEVDAAVKVSANPLTLTQPVAGATATSLAHPISWNVAISADRKQAWLLLVNPWDVPQTALIDFSASPLRRVRLLPGLGNLTAQAKERGQYEVRLAPWATGALRLSATGLERLTVVPPAQRVAYLRQRMRASINPPQATVPFVVAPPGEAGPASSQWQAALDLLPSWRSSAKPTIARVLATPQGLEVLTIARVPKDEKPQVTTRDGDVWNDFSIEVFIGNPQQPARYAQFLINTANVQQDALATPEKPIDKAYNFEWQSQVTKLDSEHSSFHFTIPWSTVRAVVGDNASDKITFNLGNGAQRWNWAGIYPFHQPELFGTLTLPRNVLN